MTLNEDFDRGKSLVNGLGKDHCPRDSDIQWILEHRRIFIGPLLNFLRDAAQCKSLPRDHADAPLHAIFLLAALEAAEA